MTILKNNLTELYEYLLLINPDSIVWQKVMAEKKYFFSLCQAEMALYGKPHITLANFVQYRMTEESILKKLREIGSQQHCIDVILQDYDHFGTHTIFVAIRDKFPFQKLYRMLRGNVYNLMKFNANDKPFIGNNPHLTISRRLEQWQFEKSWEEYRHKKFSETFIAKGMYLLRRPVMEKTKYEVVEYIDFSGISAIGLTNDLDGKLKTVGTQLSFFS